MITFTLKEIESLLEVLEQSGPDIEDFEFGYEKAKEDHKRAIRLLKQKLTQNK